MVSQLTEDFARNGNWIRAGGFLRAEKTTCFHLDVLGGVVFVLRLVSSEPDPEPALSILISFIIVLV